MSGVRSGRLGRVIDWIFSGGALHWTAKIHTYANTMIERVRCAVSTNLVPAFL